MTPLDEYRRKRDFSATPEPGGAAAGGAAAGGAPVLRYVIQKHAARALHYDFRLELDGVLVSWAIPKGPSLDPHDKRLAVHVEDHPLEYGGFEGTIPAGEYGGGTVIVWDTGTWQPLGDPHAGLAKGDFKFDLYGEKLRGRWVLVRLKPRPGEKRDNWLLIKEKDEFVRPSAEYDLLAEEPDSAVSGRSVAEVAALGDGAEDAGGTGGEAPGGRHSRPPGGDAPARIAPASPPGRLPAGAAARGESPKSKTEASTTPPASRSAPLAPAAIATAPAGAREAPIPHEIDLELATLVSEPPDSEGWIAEVKYDGYRAAIVLDGGSARAFTRSHADWTDRFAPLAAAAEALPTSSAILDGEVVVFGDDGVSGFGLLQQSLGAHPERLSFAAFDLLYLNGYDLRGLPLLARKELLATLLAEQPATSPLRYADHVVDAGDELYRQACLGGLEGVVCKKADSRYVPGRGRDWQKVKCRLTQELVVGGFTEGAGAHAELGSLLVGTYDGDRLAYAGRVGAGFDEAGMIAMRQRLDALERAESPFDPPPHITGHAVHWTKPSVVIEAAFREWTAEGHLRQPVFLGTREDKAARDVVRERPSEAEDASGNPEHAADSSAPAGAGVKRAGARKEDFGTDAEVLGITITNPAKPLFAGSAFTKLEYARYLAEIAPTMLAETSGRPLTLVRCPTGRGRGCFYQRHPDAGLSEHIHVLPHVLKAEPVELLFVDSAEGLVALGQMGAVEIHTWLSRFDAPTRPDRLVFDLDPGPDVAWAQIRATALLVREECASLGMEAFVKSTGSKGLHVVLPIEPVWEFDRVRAFAKGLAERIAARHPESLTSKMAKSQRGGRVFFDYLRNAEGASAVAPYSTRNNEGPACAVPLAWDELTDDLDIRAFTPAAVLARVASGTDPWAAIDDAAAGTKTLRSAENALLLE